MTGKIYVDSNILIYYVEGEPTLKAVAIDLLDQAMDQQKSLVTSEITVGECLIGAMKTGIDKRSAYRELFESAALVSLVPVQHSIIRRAAALGAELNMKLIDAIHIATAEALQCAVFLTNDRGIRAPAGIELHYLTADA